MRAVVTDAEVTLADVLSLRLAIDEPLAEGAELVLRHRATTTERRVPLGASATKARDATLAVSLAPLTLTPGRWDAYLAQDGPRARLRSIDPGFSLDHLDTYALSRRSLAYRAYRTQGGFLALKIDKVEPLAEVRAVWFREGRFEVTGLLAFTGLDDDESRHEARLALRRSGPEAELSVAATVQGVRFHAALSLCDVVDAAPERPGVWEPVLEVDGLPGPLRLGSRLDDVDGKRRRLHYPAARIDGVPIRPCYTADDELRIEVGG
ncbi:hypothetical protein Ppa06_56940 [Planomonospora parontospora subsp. parontospora]|uniref:Uncharacterized protein n=1 Tax=Planomonospora parontospora subsp. parontospora TaxID=97194 RepID=A0ABQ4HIG5_9ACTN|nr:hypothetical protein [Planomonospora parontospora]GII11896.1 hypothetical protein Ppa06_56940 [Planomonospora parontospora subsp. parontospora]